MLYQKIEHQFFGLTVGTYSLSDIIEPRHEKLFFWGTRRSQTHIMQTRPCNIQQYFTAVKMVNFR